VGRDGVVLVDDGNDAERQQPFEGAARVGVVRSSRHVVGREQHLSDGEVMGAEGVLIRRDERALSDAGRGLLSGQVPRTPERCSCWSRPGGPSRS